MARRCTISSSCSFSPIAISSATPTGCSRPIGFGRAHHRVLHFVSRHPGLTIAELLDILKITKQSLNRVLKELIATNFIDARAGAYDRRHRQLYATQEGEKLARELAQLQTAALFRRHGAPRPGRQGSRGGVPDRDDRPRGARAHHRIDRGQPSEAGVNEPYVAPQDDAAASAGGRRRPALARSAFHLSEQTTAIASRSPNPPPRRARISRKPGLRPHRARCDDAGRERLRLRRQSAPSLRGADPDADRARRSRTTAFAGLEIGVDDYLAKPFEPRELLLRIGSILRRTARRAEPTSEGAVVRFGPFAFSSGARRTAQRRGGRSPHRARARHLAPALRQRRRERVARGAAGVGVGGQERTVDVQINRLRRKIEDDPANPVFLQTARGSGYRLVADG